MRLRFVSSLIVCTVVLLCSVAYCAGSPWQAVQITEADVSSGGGEPKPAPAPDRSSLVERELSGESMSFSFTGDDRDVSTDEESADAAAPQVAGESIIQRELQLGGMSFGFTD